MENQLTLNKKKSYKSVIIEMISYAFILLFFYAAWYKLFDIPFFQRQLAKSPLIGDWNKPISYMVPILEICLAILLLLPKARWYGLIGGTILMLFFTLYITYILNFSPNVPCSCGGILATMGWRDHLLFNSIYVGLGVIALWLHRIPKQR